MMIALQSLKKISKFLTIKTKKCRLSSNDKFMAATTLSNSNTRIYVGVGWLKVILHI